MQIHVLAFEGPDVYSLAGGLGSRVVGLTDALSRMGHEVHLWFVGDPDAPGHERRGTLHLHRWCQWISQHHRGGVYDGDDAKALDYAESLPPFLLREVLGPALRRGEPAAVLAEEWQTAGAVLHLDRLLREQGLRSRVTMTWNANNTFGFDRIDWPALRSTVSITTVSRYMRRTISGFGVDAAVIPNGLGPDAYQPPDNAAVQRMRALLRERKVLTKMARWDPDKRWLGALAIASEMKRRGLQPLLIARGGREPYGQDVLRDAAARGLKVVERKTPSGSGPQGLVDALADLGDADVVHLSTHVDADSRRVLFRGSDAVLANSSHEPFGMVGLEAMAVGGIACIGSTGEDYGVAGHNALVLQSADPEEFLGAYTDLTRDPVQLERLRREGRNTALAYAWPNVIAKGIAPRLQLSSQRTT